MYLDDEDLPSVKRHAAALRAVLPPAAPFEARPDGPHHLTATIGSTTLRSVWVGRGRFREFLAAVETKPVPDVVVGSTLSLGARREASARGIGWVDETGAAEIVFDDLIVTRTGTTTSKLDRSPHWTSATLAACEAVLSGTRPTTFPVARATGHSISTVSQALALLTGFGFLEASAARGRNSGRRLVDKRKLLLAYAEAAKAARSKVHVRCAISWNDPIDAVASIGRTIEEMAMPWAATGAVAAARMAPYLTSYGEAEIYLDATTLPELKVACSTIGIMAMDGGRLIVRPAPTRATLALSAGFKELRVAPWPRVYADLLGVGVRGEEAAEHLFERCGG